MQNENEFDYSFQKLSSAFDRLKEGAANSIDELDKDGVIQRFEFTFELLWKTLKIFLEGEGILCRSPKDCFVEAFKYGLIEDETGFLDMLDDRNKKSHIYNKEESEGIFKKIKEKYVNEIEKLLVRISNYKQPDLPEENG